MARGIVYSGNALTPRVMRMKLRSLFKRHEVPLAERDYVDAMKLAERFKIPLIWPLQQLW